MLLSPTRRLSLQLLYSAEESRDIRISEPNEDAFRAIETKTGLPVFSELILGVSYS